MGFKTAREKANKTIAETARACGVTRQSVYGWEHGEYLPSANMLLKIADFYGCTVDHLLRDNPHEG